ncbi:WD40 repeat domain-containing protein [Pseudoclavibacter sp. CFCC 14310]|uniref:WD40 repeat domain-containing protein n=1 Tax=Pseudoclavibacter sp. CFCC 14310 TaxID=2615180 RepID=UPI001787BFA3|nr:WD40 repeat domain-containing protein [Pseudoclavibacter sp. CFCC 14310]
MANSQKATTQKRRSGSKAAYAAASTVVGLGLVFGAGAPALAAPAGASFGEAAVVAPLEVSAPSVSVDPSQVTTDGGTIHITGAGVAGAAAARGWFAVKLDKGSGSWGTGAQPAGSVESNGNYIQVTNESANLTDDGEYSFDVVIPAGFTEGDHTLHILGDGGYAPTATFTVVKKQEQGADATLTAGAVTVAADGSTTVAVTGQGYTPGAVVTPYFDGEAVTFKPARGAATATLTVPDSGSFSGNIAIAAGKAPAGSSYTATVKSDKDIDQSVEFTAAPSVSSSLATVSLNQTGTFTIGNLPAGAQLTAFGVEGENWIEGAPLTADESGSVTTSEITIPADATVNAPVIGSFTVDGQAHAFTSSLKIAPDNSAQNEEGYDIASTVIEQGSLYQVAIDETTGYLYVSSSATGEGAGSILKLDPKTLEVVEKSSISQVDGTADPVFGLGIDSKNKLVYGTSTRDNGVVIWDLNNLQAAPTVLADTSTHSRDVAVDQTTGLAYVSSSAGSTVTVFDGATKAKVGTIDLAATPGHESFTPVMSLDLDQATGKLYTVSLHGKEAVEIDVRNNNSLRYFSLGETDNSASGVAYDPVTHNLFVANQTSNDLTVVNVISGQIIKTIPVGSGALNVAYDPVHRLVYTANRTGGTFSVVDAETLTRIGNIEAGQNPNHIEVSAAGVAYGTTKDSAGNRVFAITSKADAKGAHTAVTEESATADNKGSIVLDKSTVKPGDTVKVSGLDALNGQQADAYVASDPALVADDATVADGTLTVTVPEGTTEDQHKLIITNTYGTVFGWADLTVSTDTDDNGGSGNGDGSDNGTDGNGGSDNGTGNGTGNGDNGTGGTTTGGAANGDGTLARTGADSSLLLVAGGAAAAIAAGMILAARRRQH